MNSELKTWLLSFQPSFVPQILPGKSFIWYSCIFGLEFIISSDFEFNAIFFTSDYV